MQSDQNVNDRITTIITIKVVNKIPLLKVKQERQTAN